MANKYSAEERACESDGAGGMILHSDGGLTVSGWLENHYTMLRTIITYNLYLGYRLTMQMLTQLSQLQNNR